MYLRNYRTSVMLAVAFSALLSAFWFFQSVAFIIFLSLLLQLLLLPIVVFLMKRRMSRAVASGLTLGGFVLLSLVSVLVISGTFIPTFTAFVEDFPKLAGKLQQLPFLQDSDFLTEEFDNLWNELVSYSVTAVRSSLGLIVSLFNKVVDAVIIFFVTFYLLKDGDMVTRWVANLFPGNDYERVRRLFDRILGALSIYVRSQLVICCITGAVVFIYFTLRDLPYASVFAVVSGISEFIPVLGPTVASAFGTMLTATRSPLEAAQTLGFYIVLTQINHNIVYPTLIGKNLHLHPIAIILGIVFGGEVLGAAGMFLAVPVIVIVKLVIEDINTNRIDVRHAGQNSRWLAMRRNC